VAFLLAVLALAVAFGHPSGEPAYGQAASEEANKTMEALGEICEWFNLGLAVGDAVGAATEAIGSLEIAGATKKRPNVRLRGNTVNDIGEAGERSVRKALSGREISEQFRFRTGGRGRRPDFRVGKDFVEVKNVARVARRYLAQFKDYARRAAKHGGHTIIAIRRGARLSRTTAKLLFAMQKKGLISIMSCAFPY
jgi:hypothetical protein